MTTRRQTLRLDVSAVAPPGARYVVADVIVPLAPIVRPARAVFCLPGGGMSRRYFDLGTAESLRGYSMAEHLAAEGLVVILQDHPGVGDSDVPDDGYALSPDCVADVNACAAEQVLVQLRAGSLGLPALPELTSVGLGHSAGALLTVVQQARHRTHRALVTLGFSGRGLPEALTADEAAYAERPQQLRDVLADLARTRFGSALPDVHTSASDYLIAVPIPDAVRAALAESRAAMLALVGLLSMVPGSIRAELETVDVPVFVGNGELDITGPPDDSAGSFPAAPDVTCYVLDGSGHNHNVAPTREKLWRRVADWIVSLPVRDEEV